MSDTVKYSPTPWEIYVYSSADESDCWGVCNDEIGIAEGIKDKTDARHIVCCVNTHDDLIEALEASERQYRDLSQYFGHKFPADATGTNKKRRTALALAKGE